MGMFQLMSSLSVVAVILPIAIMAAAIPFVVYLVARSRNRHENADNPDDQIGLKVALHFFRFFTFQLGLAAAFLFLLGIISSIPTGDTIRIALGLGIPAGGLWFLHHSLLTKTNNTTHPAVGRMFNGWNMIVTGIPGMGALIALSVVIVAPGLSGGRGDILRAVFPYLMTYTGAWALLGYRWFIAAGLITPAAPSAGIPPAGFGGGQGGYQQPPQAQASFQPQPQPQPQQPQQPYQPPPGHGPQGPQGQ